MPEFSNKDHNLLKYNIKKDPNKVLLTLNFGQHMVRGFSDTGD